MKGAFENKAAFFKSKSKDSIHVLKNKHEMERLAPLNSKDDKVSYIHNHLDDDHG